MNPVLIVLVILFATLLWFLLAFAFRPIGSLFSKLWNDVMDIIFDKDKILKNEKENKNE